MPFYHDYKCMAIVFHVSNVIFAEITSIENEANIFVIILFNFINHISELGYICDGSRIFLIKKWYAIILVICNCKIEDWQALIIFRLSMLD